MAFQFTEEQLNTLDKSFIVELFLQLQEQNQPSPPADSFERHTHIS